MSIRWGVLVVLGVTLWRVVMLAFDRTDLFVDEAQYWFWGRNLDWGYYSKPPLIGWLIRAATTLAGSDARFFVRLPAPLLHMATALLLMAAAARVLPPRGVGAVGALYVTLPLAALGSALISTDSVMLPFWALALWLWLRATEPAPPGWTGPALGAAIGFGLLAKYAMAYFALGMALAAFAPATRIRWRQALAVAVTTLAVIAPNLVWNATHGAVTFRHTAGNAGLGAAALHPLGALGFLATQAGVFGPLTAGALALGLARDRRLAAFVLPPLLAVATLAMASRVNANWAVAAFAAGTIVAAGVLAPRRRWLVAAILVNGAATLAIPLAAAFAPALVTPGGDVLLHRYLGRADVSLEIADAARFAGLGTIVAGNRDILADLFYTLRAEPIRIYAFDRGGFPDHFYEATRPVPPELSGDVLAVTFAPFPCPGTEALGTLRSDAGAYRGRTIWLTRAPARCLATAP